MGYQRKADTYTHAMSHRQVEGNHIVSSSGSYPATPGAQPPPGSTGTVAPEQGSNREVWNKGNRADISREWDLRTYVRRPHKAENWLYSDVLAIAQAEVGGSICEPPGDQLRKPSGIYTPPAFLRSADPNTSTSVILNCSQSDQINVTNSNVDL